MGTVRDAATATHSDSPGPRHVGKFRTSLIKTSNNNNDDDDMMTIANITECLLCAKTKIA